MKSLVLIESGKLVLSDMDIPVPGPEEILIKTKAATICTSDFADIKENPFNAPLPVILGHECSGVVAGVGEGVKTFKVGDRVANHSFMHCTECYYCKNGLPQLCENMDHLGFHRGGGFAEYYVMRQDRVRLIPENVTFPQATLLEPVSVCLEGLERVRAGAGKNVLILGDGPFGILMAKLCCLYEPKNVIMLGRHDSRMSHVSHAIKINERISRDVQKDIREITAGRGVECAVLCVASKSAVDAAVDALSPRGTLCVFSAIPGKTPVDLFKLHVKELSIQGSCNDPGYMDKALLHIGRDTEGINDVITHTLPFTDWREAFELAEKDREHALKVCLIFE